MGIFADRSLRTKIFAGSLLALLIMLITAARLYNGIRVSRDRVAWVTHTYQVIGGAERLLLQSVNMQTSYRGYLLSGDQGFLAPFNEGRQAVGELQAELTALVSDNPPQVRRLRAIAATGETWYQQVAEPGIAMRAALASGATPPGEIAVLERTAQDKQLFDLLRAQTREFLLVEQSLLRTRLNESQQAADQLRQELVVGVGLALLLSAGLSILIAGSIARRVNRVAEVAAAMAAGDLNAYSALPSGNDEVGRMSTAFGKMAAIIRQQIDVAEQARSESRAVFDSTNEAMVLIGPDMRVRTVNSRASNMLGIEAERVVGRAVEELTPVFAHVFSEPELVGRLLSEPATAASQPSVVFVEQREPQQRELELAATPVTSAEGAYLGQLYVFRDVTQQRAVDRMKSEFVSMVSHELRTPLTSIKGYVSLLMDGEVGELTADQLEFLSIVQANTDRQVALINALLDLTRIEAGKIEIQRAPVDLASIITLVKTSLRPQLAAKQQTLSLEMAPDLPWVIGDADRLTQVMTNLLSNAYKYTPAGGAISIRAAARDGQVVIDVADTGIGMSPDEQAQLFTKFFRAKNRTTEEVGGTGLGLSITRALIELHGGTIGVTSAPGEGTTFSVSLPAASEVVQVNAFAEAMDLVRPGGRVLIVDDEPHIAKLIQRYLQRGGYEAMIAANGTEALRLAQREHPDLILLDIVLPDADGFTVLEWLKQDSATAAIPVVMLSIVPDDGRGALLGAVDYMTKPISRDLLVDRVRRVLAAGQGQRIVVADDDPSFRTLLVKHLRQAGYVVTEASDGEGAVAAIRAARPHLVLLDVHMPIMDGVAALRSLRADEQTRELPVIMISATPGTFDARREAIELLGSSLLRKPCTAEELAATIADGLKHGATR